MTLNFSVWFALRVWASSSSVSLNVFFRLKLSHHSICIPWGLCGTASCLLGLCLSCSRCNFKFILLFRIFILLYDYILLCCHLVFMHSYVCLLHLFYYRHDILYSYILLFHFYSQIFLYISFLYSIKYH